MELSDFTEKTLFSETVFEGTLLRVFRDTVRLPDGKTSGREYIRHIGAVCAVPLTDDGRVIVERQYRYPIGTETLELPAGKKNSREEDPETAVRRELREETGISAGKLSYLGPFYPAAAYSDEVIFLYLAEELTFGEDQLDEDEFLSVNAVPLEELVGEILAGRVPDAKTQAAVLRVYLMKKRP